MTAHLHLSWLSPVKVRRMIIAGTKQSLIFDDLDQEAKIKLYDHGVGFDMSDLENRRQVLVSYRKGDMRAPAVSTSEALEVQLEEIARVLAADKEGRATGVDGLAVVKVLEAAEYKVLETDNGQLALDMIVDCPDAQAAQRQPGWTGPAVRHGFSDHGLGDPVKRHAGLAAPNEKVSIAPTEEIEPQVERGQAQPGKDRSGHQAIAATIDDGNRTAFVIGRTKRRMMAQVAIKGFRATVERRLLCFSLFWHALDIVWVGLFTVVYLMGVLA